MSQLSEVEGSLISVRLFTMDHYMADPIPDLDVTYSPTRCYTVKKVPVLRIFGPTAAGQKCCLHLHGVFPYMYVPVSPNPTAGFTSRLASSLDKAINITFGMSDSKTQHVYKVEEVSGVPFYGYHPRHHSFYKVFFYNPILIKRASDMLQNGGVMNLVLQPHEAHVPYTLQFMMDYDLQGMNYLRLANAKFRRRKREDGATSQRSEDSFKMSASSSQEWQYATRLVSASSRTFDVDKIPTDMLLDENRTPPMSTSELELDAVAADLVVREGLDGDDDGMNPGLEALWEDERERRRRLDIDERLSPPSSPTRPETSTRSTDSDKFWKDRFLAKLDGIKKDTSKIASGVETSQSSDADATCNFNPSAGSSSSLGGSQKSRVYPVETPEGIVLRKATLVHTHVPSLSLSAAENKRKRKRSDDVKEAGDDADLDYLDDTIVDEAVVVSQSQSDPGAADLDDDDRELIELFAQLGAERDVGSAENSLQTRRLSKKKCDDQDDQDTLEMSQVESWNEPDEFGSQRQRGEKEEKRSRSGGAGAGEQEDEVWGDESFWDQLDIDKYIHL
jgi:DNA polymerase zeta